MVIKAIKISTFVLSILLFSGSALAVGNPTLELSQKIDVPHLEEEFIVDINLNLDSEIINGIVFNLSVSDNLELIDVLDSDTFISLWISKPEVINNHLQLSGITPGGFSGTINPGQGEYVENRVVSVLLKARKPGIANVSLKNAEVTLHDGRGTVIDIPDIKLEMNVSNVIKKYSLIEDDKIPPEEFVPVLIRDKSLFGDDYGLIFTTKDYQSGIARYEVREDDGLYVQATSPYRLRGGETVDIIYVRAIDRAGNDRTIALQTNFEDKAFEINKTTALLVAALLVLIIYLVARKRFI